MRKIGLFLVILFLVLAIILPFFLSAQTPRAKECCAIRHKYKCDDFPTCCVYPPGTANPGEDKGLVIDRSHGVCTPEAFIRGNTNPVWIGKPGGYCPQANKDWNGDGNPDPGATDIVPPENAVAEWGLICLFETIFNITDFIAYLLFAIAVIMGIISGILFMTAGGDPGKVETARKLLIYLIVGLIVAVLAKMIPSIVLTVVA